jgi:hypothetical protein
MARRILLGNAGGGNVVFRVSKATADVLSTNLNDFLFNEQIYNSIPLATGTITALQNQGQVSSGSSNYYFGLSISFGVSYLPMLIVTNSQYDPNFSGKLNLTISYSGFSLLTYKASSASSIALSIPISYIIYQVAVG